MEEILQTELLELIIKNRFDKTGKKRLSVLEISQIFNSMANIFHIKKIKSFENSLSELERYSIIKLKTKNEVEYEWFEITDTEKLKDYYTSLVKPLIGVEMTKNIEERINLFFPYRDTPKKQDAIGV